MENKTGPCQGLAGMLFGHRFHARYETQSDESSVDQPKPYEVIDVVRSAPSDEFVENILTALSDGNKLFTRNKRYLCDVCKRCGQVVTLEFVAADSDGPVVRVRTD